MRVAPGKALVVLALLSCATVPVRAQDAASQEGGPGGPKRGTRFEVARPGSLVASVDTSVAVDALLHATPRSFVMAVSPVPGGGGTDGDAGAGGAGQAAAARLTLHGLVPETAYYRYTDDFQNVEVVLSDAEGRHAFDLDISRPRLVILQPNPSTVHLKADGTGCPLIGTWEAATLTCRLRRNVGQTIEIDDDGVTLDGEGFTIDGTSVFLGTSGVMVGARTGVTVRDLVIDGAPIGVITSGTRDSLFEDITMTNAEGGFLAVFQSPSSGAGHNTYRNNVVDVVCPPGTPCGYGFSGLINNSDAISGNLVTGAEFGILSSLTVLPGIAGNTLAGCGTGISVLASLAAATVSGNAVTGGTTGIVVNGAIGCALTGNVVDGAAGDAARLGSRECSVTDNTFRNSGRGLNVLGQLNVVVHNQFLDNVQQAEVGPDATGTLLSQDPRTGGNHWSDFDESAEGCDDLNGDGYCDTPYASTGGQDLNPWTAPGGWLDLIPPSTGVSFEGLAGNAGWFRSAVNAIFSADDNPGGSGVLRSEYGFDGAAFTPAPGPVGLADEGTTSLFYRSIDRAGNAETPLSVAVLIDATPPSIEAALSPPANAGGWNNAAVTVSFTCEDEHSGVASCPAPRTVSGEGAGQEVQESALDVAGNTAEITQGVSIDLSPPEIAFAGGCGATAFLNQPLSTQVTVLDELSGVAAQSIPDGAFDLPTSSPGPQALEATASDLAGNDAAASCEYGVVYDFLGAGGFLPPVDLPPVVNVAKAGSTVPVKWRLPNGLGGFLESLAVVSSIRAQQVSCSSLDEALADPIETTTSGASGLRYDPTSQQYAYNWKTGLTMAGKCFALYLNLNDGEAHRADFRFAR